MRYLYLLIPIIFFIAISECSACSLKFISPQKGSTVDKSNITVYGTGKTNHIRQLQNDGAKYDWERRQIGRASCRERV